MLLSESEIKHFSCTHVDFHLNSTSYYLTEVLKILPNKHLFPLSKFVTLHSCQWCHRKA